MIVEPQTVDIEFTGKPRRFVFVLMDQFTMLCFASAIESLRIANRTAGKKLYSWSIIGEGGENATCSNGCTFHLDSDFVELERDDTIMLCGGIVHTASHDQESPELDPPRGAPRGDYRVGFAPLDIQWPRLAFVDGARPRSTGKTKTALPKNLKKLR